MIRSIILLVRCLSIRICFMSVMIILVVISGVVWVGFLVKVVLEDIGVMYGWYWLVVMIYG